MSDNGVGAAATTEAVRDFARSVSLKVGGGGGKTKTQFAVEQARAAMAAQSRSPLLSAGTMGVLLRVQAHAKA